MIIIYCFRHCSRKHMCYFIQALRQIYRHFLTEMKSDSDKRFTQGQISEKYKVMNFTFLNYVGLCVSSHNFITTESLKSRLHMSLDQFKLSCECVFQYQLSKNKITYISPGYYNLHIRVSFVWTWTIAFSH